VLAQDVRPGQAVVRTEGRILDERRTRVEGAGQREDRGQFLVLDPDQAGRLVSAATAATGSPWYLTSPSAMTGRSANWGPNRASGCGRSAAVTISRTPGTASAALVSIDTIRACAQGTVTNLATSSPGRWMSAT